MLQHGESLPTSEKGRSENGLPQIEYASCGLLLMVSQSAQNTALRRKSALKVRRSSPFALAENTHRPWTLILKYCVVSLVIDDLMVHHDPQLEARQEVVHPRRKVMVGHLSIQEAHNSMFPVLARCPSKVPITTKRCPRVNGEGQP
jgi:hypothetical protein